MADESDIFIQECYGANSLPRQYRLSKYRQSIERTGRYKDKKFSSISKFFKSAFLPQGYPESVSADYLEYQIWDTIQAFCSSITGALATQAMLKGYGVGDESATALAATMTWMLKDGTGMLGRILFAWYEGNNLDCYAKKWRLFADVLNDFATLLDLLAPLFKMYFVFIACISSLARSIVGVAGGATRAAMTQHQARRDNMADVSAKDGSQETLVNLVALIINLILIPVVSGNQMLIWCLFFVFTFSHIYANYRAVTSVVMETANIPRMHLLVEEYLRSGQIMTPTETAAREPIFLSHGNCLTVHIGCSVSSVITSYEDYQSSQVYSKGCKYLMRLNMLPKLDQGNVYITLHNEADGYDELQCCFQAAVLDIAIKTSPSMNKVYVESEYGTSLDKLKSYWDSEKSTSPTVLWDMVKLSQEFTHQVFPAFLRGLQSSGWKTKHTQVGPDEWRATWDIPAGRKDI